MEGNFCSECGLILIVPQTEQAKMNLIKIAIKESFEKDIHRGCITDDITGYNVSLARPGKSCPKCQLYGLTVLCRIKAILDYPQV